MALFLWQLGYTSDSWATQIKNPANRIDAVRPVAQKFGGDIVDAWLSFGDYDAVALVEMPDNESMGALVLAAVSGGHLSSSKTTPLISVETGISAMKRAGEIVYPTPE